MPRQSAGGVVMGSGGRIVLVYQHANSWSFPKGGVEEGESELQAAVREIEEETGITELTHVADLGSYERYSIAQGGVGEDLSQGIRKRTFFLFTTNQMDTKQKDDEVTQVRWVTLDEALALLTHPKDREFLESVRGTIESYDTR